MTFAVSVDSYFKQIMNTMRQLNQKAWYRLSSNQLHSGIEITSKRAWFMTHRIRETMKEREF